MTRRHFKGRIDPEQSHCLCMLPKHKPVRPGREIVDLLAVEAPKPCAGEDRRGVVEAAIEQLFKCMRSSCAALPPSGQ
jgi:hypothetical protein